ncbi:MAG: hypothetical protein P9F19_01725 [Candidatus Contendobacter sp.]|nr:hypothetical protein [Candidatus Contendobacter sp.]MDG4556109.1 hypothetical protein [Candidatus Contendobacter sp.]
MSQSSSPAATIPHPFGERAVLKRMFAALTRASQTRLRPVISAIVPVVRVISAWLLAVRWRKAILATVRMTGFPGSLARHPKRNARQRM